MWLSAILWSLSFGLVLSQNTCITPTLTSTFTPVVMRYTPYMTPQIAPISTVWETIVTTWFNAVDCRYLTPLRVDENPAAEGPFTTYVRSPTLTVTRVGCMPETTAVTRRDIRGQNRLEVRTASPRQEHKIHKRRTTSEVIDKVIGQMTDKFPPDVTGLTVQAYRYLVSVNTAIFAINLVQAPIDLNQTCAHLRDPASMAGFFNSRIDPIQAGDIVCFAADHGLFFSNGVDEVVTYLESLIYALQAKSSQNNSDDFCWPLITEDSPFLGINTNGIAEYLCPGSTASLTTSTSNIATSHGPVSTSGIRGTGVGTIVGPPSGAPFANTTASSTTGYPGYGGNTTAIEATTTQAPYSNSTSITSTAEFTTAENATIGTIGTIGTVTTYGTGLTFPNATYPTVGTGFASLTGNLPPLPTSVSPSIESVTSTPTRRFRRW